jgi:large subunit ribosomal protein L23
MALFDILRSRKREEVKPERLPRGALKRVERPVKKREEIKFAPVATEEKPKKGEKAKITSVKTSTGKEEKEVKTAQSYSAKAPQGKSLLAAEFLLKPHITEQSNISSQKGVYTFRVHPSANKIIVKKAIKEMYGFKPVKVSIINIPAKKRIVRGKTGTKSGFKKALVYLKSGDKIEFV